jgi:hypothetical protein
MGFPMPAPWSLNQIKETVESLGGVNLSLDRDVVSRNALTVDLSGVKIPPPEEYPNVDSGTGFDRLYEWVISSEFGCERTLVGMPLMVPPPILNAPRIWHYILGWLRKEKYWGGLLWPLYTPEIELGPSAMASRQACVDFLNGLAPDIRVLLDDDFHDVRHFAATTLGYRQFPLRISNSLVGFGDLGGWPLDLLQLWGQYQRLGDPGIEGLSAFASHMLGMIGTSPEYGDESVFSYADLVADSDALLVSNRMSTFSLGRQLSRALREVHTESSSGRIRWFYEERFNRNPSNLIEGFVRMVNGVYDPAILVPSWFNTSLLLNAANATAMPTDEQATVLATNLVNYLEQA